MSKRKAPLKKVTYHECIRYHITIKYLHSFMIILTLEDLTMKVNKSGCGFYIKSLLEYSNNDKFKLYEVLLDF